MAFWSRWFSGGALSNPDKGAQSSGPSTHTTDSGLILTDERAMSLSAVWSCVRLITETVGSLPIAVYERTAEGRNKVEDHYLHDLLLVSPNALMNPLEFREAMTMALVLWGNAYAKIDRDKAGRPFSLIPLRPDLVTPVREVGTVTYHYHANGTEHIFAKESVLHLCGMSVDGVVGLSPLAYARHTMGISASADKFASKSFQGSGRYRGFVSVDRLLTPEQREKLSQMYDTASADESKTWVFEAGSKFNQTSMSPDDMQMLQSRSFQLGEIARIFRVPSYLINDTEKSTSWGTGIEQQNLGFLTYTLRPYLTRWESAIEHSLLDRTQRRKFYVEHNVEGLLRADSAARAAYFASALQNRWLVVNEVRRLDNWPPVPWGDKPPEATNVSSGTEGNRNGNQNPTD